MVAARARRRVKDQLADLNARVQVYGDTNSKLQEANEELVRRVAVLTEENLVLRQQLRNQHPAGLATAATSLPGVTDTAAAAAAAAVAGLSGIGTSLLGGGAGAASALPINPSHALRQQALLQSLRGTDSNSASLTPSLLSSLASQTAAPALTTASHLPSQLLLALEAEQQGLLNATRNAI